MHPLYEKAEVLSQTVISAGIHVHRHFGPGLLESIYEWALRIELTQHNLTCEQQKTIPIVYRGLRREELLRFDLLVEDCLLLEIKAIKATESCHEAQLLSYMRLLDVPVGLILNFHSPTLRQGIKRLTLWESSQVPSMIDDQLVIRAHQPESP